MEVGGEKVKLRRRKWLKYVIGSLGMMLFFPWSRILSNASLSESVNRKARETVSEIFMAKNGTPQENVQKVIEMFGGIESFIGLEDIVVIKPNCQWWNQGRTNLAAVKGFIDLVLSIPRFNGEIIIGENTHFVNPELLDEEKDNGRGWTHRSEINGDIEGENHNFNSLIGLYKRQGRKNVTKSHWRDGGSKRDFWGNGQNGGIVKCAAEGDGYVWTDTEYVFSKLWGFRKWKVKMSYPIFTSKYSGITVDFKHGAFRRHGSEGGVFLKDKPVKLINFAPLNDHGQDTGITGSVKNYMGITDLSCGYWGLQPPGYANVHFCGENYYPYAKGGPLGYFMKTIRRADINIITAEWVGWGSRTDPEKAIRKKAILASTDAISLDYYAAKHFVYPLTHNKEHHDPGNPNSSVRQFLKLASNAAKEGTLDERFIKMHEFDFCRIHPEK